MQAGKKLNSGSDYCSIDGDLTGSVSAATVKALVRLGMIEVDKVETAKWPRYPSYIAKTYYKLTAQGAAATV